MRYCNPNKAKHRNNVALFEAIEKRYPWLELFQPSPDKAPWHEQAVIKSASGEDIWLNFWPCALKAQRDGEKSVDGIDAIRMVISQAIDDSQSEERFSVIDD